MSFTTYKTVLFFIACVTFFCLLCSNPLDVSFTKQSGPEPLGPNYIKVDAVTSASKRFKLDSARVYPTQAELFWYERFSNGDKQYLYWGTSASNFSDSINLQEHSGSGRNYRIIDSLTPETTYHVQFYRKYKGQTDGNCDFSFTTPAQE